MGFAGQTGLLGVDLNVHTAIVGNRLLRHVRNVSNVIVFRFMRNSIENCFGKVLDSAKYSDWVF